MSYEEASGPIDYSLAGFCMNLTSYVVSNAIVPGSDSALPRMKAFILDVHCLVSSVVTFMQTEHSHYPKYIDELFTSNNGELQQTLLEPDYQHSYHVLSSTSLTTIRVSTKNMSPVQNNDFVSSSTPEKSRRVDAEKHTSPGLHRRFIAGSLIIILLC